MIRVYRDVEQDWSFVQIMDRKVDSVQIIKQEKKDPKQETIGIVEEGTKSYLKPDDNSARILNLNNENSNHKNTGPNGGLVKILLDNKTYQKSKKQSLKTISPKMIQRKLVNFFYEFLNEEFDQNNAKKDFVFLNKS